VAIAASLDVRVEKAPARSARRLSPTSAFVATALTFAAFYLAAGAPTPLLVIFQQQWHFAAWVLTVAFAIYALGLLAALLVVGSLSDHIGRRPVLVAALVVELIAMVMFAVAPDVGWVIAARAIQGIATLLASRYPQDARIKPTIDAVQQIYTDNFFPEMKANWQAYPDNIGHKDWPGCFRCHDGNHKTSDGKRVIKANDCNACHTILAQGSGKELEQLSPTGLKFKHPGDEVDGACNDCHTGGL